MTEGEAGWRSPNLLSTGTAIRNTADWMGSAPLPKATDLRRGALVAALVHALCIRDGLPIPEWVLGWRHPTPVNIYSAGMDDSPFSRSVRSQSPSICDYHQAYFETSFRDKR